MLIELTYLPPVAWWSLAWQRRRVILEANEHFQKGSYRNRCHIASPNGVQRLSIPLKHGKHQQTPIREVEIAYTENWQQVHWRSMVAGYGRAPYFEHFAPFLEPFFQRRFRFLFDFNYELLLLLTKKMDLEIEFEFSATFQPKNVKNPDDFRDLISPKNMPHSAHFLPKKYAQVFEEKHGFLTNLSGLDLLFCHGRNVRDILG